MIACVERGRILMKIQVLKNFIRICLQSPSFYRQIAGYRTGVGEPCGRLMVKGGNGQTKCLVGVHVPGTFDHSSHTPQLWYVICMTFDRGTCIIHVIIRCGKGYVCVSLSVSVSV